MKALGFVATVLLACLALSGCVTRVMCPAPPAIPACPSCPASLSWPGGGSNLIITPNTITPGEIITPCTPETCGGIKFK